MSTRAGIVVTGTEVLTGRVADRNGRWLAEQLRQLGVDVGHLVVVGDRPDDLRQALAFLAHSGVSLILTTGGLGPTADDLTAEVVARFQGRPVELDERLRTQIGQIVAGLTAARGWRLDRAATEASVRKQALVPIGASVLAPVGTAPGLVVPVAEGRSGPPVVVLPGPPRELQPMWPLAAADPLVQDALAGRQELRQRTLRLWDTPESELAATLRENQDRLAGLEISTCLHGGELEIVARYHPSAEPNFAELASLIAAGYPATLFSPDGATVDELVARALLDSGRTVATAESCTAGMLAARLTDLAGSSAYVRGGLVVYSNEAKLELAGVPMTLIERVGAVSAEVAEALANGARKRLAADIGVGITGVAGPGGGTERKPVGLVHLCVADDRQIINRRVQLPGGRADVRERATLIAMHLLRQLLTGMSPEQPAQ